MIFFFAVAVATGFSTASHAEVSEKVKKLFNESFRDVTNVHWSDYQQYYEVKFTRASISTRMLYDTDGNILETYRYYGEDQLPPMLISKLNHKYTDREIFGVTELSSENGTTYYIVMDDAKNWYTVQSDEKGHFDQIRKYKRS